MRKLLDRALPMKILAVLLLAPILTLWVVPAMPVQAASYTPPFEVDAGAAYLVNLDTGTVIYEKNAHQKMYPASTTKILTTILALENTPDLDGTTVIYPQYIQDTLYQIGNVSLGGLTLGEELSMRQLIYAMMLRSANECAMMVADHLGDGSQEYFAEMMNQKAREIGAIDSHFVNANGLHDDNHYTTAYDLHLIAKYAMGIDGFMEIAETPVYNTGATNKHDNLMWEHTVTMQNPNSSTYYEPLHGIKTGTTPEAGRCLVSTASRDGYTYLLVLLDATYLDAEGNVISPNQAFVESRLLYEWAFSSFRVKTIVESGRSVNEIPLELAWGKDYLTVMTGESFSCLMPVDIDISNVAFVFDDLPEAIRAPVEKGDPVGRVTLVLAGEEIGSVPLLAAESAERNEVLYAMDRIQSVFRSFWFKFALIFVILLIILYITLMVMRNNRKKKHKSVKRRRNL